MVTPDRPCSTGSAGRPVDRSQPAHVRERVSDVDLELLIELASGSQWLWWVVVTFGAGFTGREAVTAVVSNGDVVVGETCRPIVGPLQDLMLIPSVLVQLGWGSVAGANATVSTSLSGCCGHVHRSGGVIRCPGSHNASVVWP